MNKSFENEADYNQGRRAFQSYNFSEKKKRALFQIVEKMQHHQKTKNSELDIDSVIKQSCNLLNHYESQAAKDVCRTEGHTLKPYSNRQCYNSLQVSSKLPKIDQHEKALQFYSNRVNEINEQLKTTHEKQNLRYQQRKMNQQQKFQSHDHSPVMQITGITPFPQNAHSVEFNTKIKIVSLQYMQTIEDISKFTFVLNIPNLHTKNMRKKIANLISPSLKGLFVEQIQNLPTSQYDVPVPFKLAQKCEAVRTNQELHSLVKRLDSTELQQIVKYYFIPSKILRSQTMEWLLEMINENSTEIFQHLQNQDFQPVAHIWNKNAEHITETTQIAWDEGFLFVAPANYNLGKKDFTIMKHLEQQENEAQKQEQRKPKYSFKCSTDYQNEKNIEKSFLQSQQQTQVLPRIEIQQMEERKQGQVQGMSLNSFVFQSLQQIKGTLSQQEAELLIQNFNRLLRQDAKENKNLKSINNINNSHNSNSQIEEIAMTTLQTEKQFGKINQQNFLHILKSLEINVLPVVNDTKIQFDQYCKLHFLQKREANSNIIIKFLKRYFDPQNKVFLSKSELKTQIQLISKQIEQTKNEFDEMFAAMLLKSFEALNFVKGDSIDINQFQFAYHQNLPFMNYLLQWIFNEFEFKKMSQARTYSWEKFLEL